MKQQLKKLRSTPYWPLFKWALMSMGLLWILVFKLSQQAMELPQFVYVNF